MAFEPIPLSSPGDSAPSPCDSAPSCLHQYIDNARVAELPASGVISFRYTRGPLTLRQAGDGRDASASADFKFYEITNAVAGAPEETETPQKTSDTIDRLFAEALQAKPETEE